MLLTVIMLVLCVHVTVGLFNSLAKCDVIKMALHSGQWRLQLAPAPIIEARLSLTAVSICTGPWMCSEERVQWVAASILLEAVLLEWPHLFMGSD